MAATAATDSSTVSRRRDVRFFVSSIIVILHLAILAVFSFYNKYNKYTTPK